MVIRLHIVQKQQIKHETDRRGRFQPVQFQKKPAQAEEEQAVLDRDHALERNRREKQHAFQQERIPRRPVRHHRRVPGVRHGVGQIDGTVHRELDRKKFRPGKNHIIYGPDRQEKGQQGRFGNRRAEIRKEDDPRLERLEKNQQEEEREDKNRRGQVSQDRTA
ncbi:MAG: hypothetical protein BWY31_04616 [Lentisphaerae bacterium ADurb.Bin242]|nr:MAG: hypothetical protein BWY31_04616 [Lentisphaerae bacterium ADurb.Bin242]